MLQRKTGRANTEEQVVSGDAPTGQFLKGGKGKQDGCASLTT